MNAIYKVSFVLVIFISLTALSCATVPSQSELANADYGIYPENYQEIVKAYFSRKLIDPYYAQYRIKTPYKGYFSGGAFRSPAFGYVVEVGINVKKRFGGYVEKSYMILIKNGAIIKRIAPMVVPRIIKLKRRKPLMLLNGLPPCVLMSRIGENKWFNIKATTATSVVTRGKNKTRMMPFLQSLLNTSFCSLYKIQHLQSLDHDKKLILLTPA